MTSTAQPEAKPTGHRITVRCQFCETWNRVVAESAVPVMVDFYADWCGPCKIMAPSVDQLASETQGKLLVAKLDTDRSPRTAQSFDILGIPTVIVFESGKEARRSTGAMP